MTETLEETFTEMVEGPVLTTSTEAVPKRKKRQKLGPEHAEMIAEGVKKRVAEILAESAARMALVEAAPGADARAGGRSEAGDVLTRNRAAVHALAVDKLTLLLGTEKAAETEYMLRYGPDDIADRARYYRELEADERLRLEFRHGDNPGNRAMAKALADETRQKQEFARKRDLNNIRAEIGLPVVEDP